MSSGLNLGVTLELLLVFLFCLIVTRRYFDFKAALLLVGVRLAIPALYFAFFFSQEWTIGDDVEYFEDAWSLVEAGYTPWSLLGAEGRAELSVPAQGGRHILYLWWNHLAQYLFGRGYYVPVFLNIALSFAVASWLTAMVKMSGLGDRIHLRLLYVFAVFHWDVVTWTSFLNVKEPLVLFLCTAVFFCFFSALYATECARKKALWLLSSAAAMFALTWLRYYVPVLIFVSLMIWAVYEYRSRNVYVILAVGLVIGWLAFPYITSENIETQHINLDLVQFLYGIVRFPLTPRPWGLEGAYHILLIAATLHWLAFMPMLIGGWSLGQSGPLFRALAIYALVMVCFYASVVYLQDARHRYQLVIVEIWMQYQGIRLLLERWRSRSVSAG